VPALSSGCEQIIAHSLVRRRFGHEEDWVLVGRLRAPLVQADKAPKPAGRLLHSETTAATSCEPQAPSFNSDKLCGRGVPSASPGAGPALLNNTFLLWAACPAAAKNHPSPFLGPQPETRNLSPAPPTPNTRPRLLPVPPPPLKCERPSKRQAPISKTLKKTSRHTGNPRLTSKSPILRAPNTEHRTPDPASFRSPLHP